MGLFFGKKERLDKFLIQNQANNKAYASIAPVVTHELGGKKEKVVISFSRVYGFENAVKARELYEGINLLNDYYKMIIDATLKFEGEFLGIFAGFVFNVFGAQIRHHNDIRRAARCSLEIQREIKEFNEERTMRGLEIMKVGMALNVGEVLIGHFGSSRRMNYSAIGEPVDLCCKFCEMAEPGQVLATQGICDDIKDLGDVILLRPYRVSNTAKPIPVFHIKNLRQYHSELSVKYTGVV
ncbi:MAG: adenylate/guanylate cyclase domain-containing protein [bacterium]|nr:adenylate/guanylate cyclase domain-containing protein [bacterium]